MVQTTGVVYMLSPPLRFWAASQINLFICLVTPRSDSVSSSPCLWSERLLPAYWPVSVCRFDLILVVPNILTSITAPPPLAFTLMQCFLTILRHSSLGSFWNFSFLPYYTISAGWLKRFKRHFCDDSDCTLWVVALLRPFNKSLLYDN